MNQKIVIENPCNANWNEMTKNNSGRHCATCSTTVVDFSKMSLSDIELYFKSQAGKKICGKYHTRHVQTNQSNTWFTFLNKFEFSFSNPVFKRVAIALINLLLFVSCKSKQKNVNVMGDRYYFAEQPNKTEKVILPKDQH